MCALCTHKHETILSPDGHSFYFCDSVCDSNVTETKNYSHVNDYTTIHWHYEFIWRICLKLCHNDKHERLKKIQPKCLLETSTNEAIINGVLFCKRRIGFAKELDALSFLCRFIVTQAWEWIDYILFICVYIHGSHTILNPSMLEHVFPSSQFLVVVSFSSFPNKRVSSFVPLILGALTQIDNIVFVFLVSCISLSFFCVCLLFESYVLCLELWLHIFIRSYFFIFFFVSSVFIHFTAQLLLVFWRCL